MNHAVHDSVAETAKERYEVNMSAMAVNYRTEQMDIDINKEPLSRNEIEVLKNKCVSKKKREEFIFDLLQVGGVIIALLFFIYATYKQGVGSSWLYTQVIVIGFYLMFLRNICGTLMFFILCRLALV